MIAIADLVCSPKKNTFGILLVLLTVALASLAVLAEIETDGYGTARVTKKKVVLPPLTIANCAPQAGVDENGCKARMAYCGAQGFPMKWSVKGCSRPDGSRWGDAGCRCQGYCAYHCRDACISDRECYWNATNSACMVKATGKIGDDIPNCATTGVCPPKPRSMRCGGDSCTTSCTATLSQSEGACFRQFGNLTNGICALSAECFLYPSCTRQEDCAAGSSCVETCCDQTYTTGTCLPTCDS